MFWFGECCAVPAQVGLVMTRHSPLFCCVCIARVPQASCLCHAGTYGYHGLSGMRQDTRSVCFRAEAAQPAARVCANDAQSRAWLACGGHTCLCFMSRADQGWSPPSPCFASFEGVAPAVLPILYSTIGGSPCSRVQGNPGLLTQLISHAGMPEPLADSATPCIPWAGISPEAP